MTGFAGPQSMPVAGGLGVVYGPALWHEGASA